MASLKSSRSLLIASSMVFGIFAATGIHAQQSSDKAVATDRSTSTYKHKPSWLSEKKEGERIAEVPVKIIVPMQASNVLATDKDCWTRLYDKKNYQGDSFLLKGPIDLAQMIGPFGINWENKVLSIETGPKSNLTIFNNRDFKGENKVIDPNIKIPDLSRKAGFFDDFQSMKLNCIQPG